MDLVELKGWRIGKGVLYQSQRVSNGPGGVERAYPLNFLSSNLSVSNGPGGVER